MASTEAAQLKSQFDALSKGAYLDILLPKSPDLDIQKALQEGSIEDVSRIPSRRNLFFGKQDMNDP